MKFYQLLSTALQLLVLGWIRSLSLFRYWRRWMMWKNQSEVVSRFHQAQALIW